MEFPKVWKIGLDVDSTGNLRDWLSKIISHDSSPDKSSSSQVVHLRGTNKEEESDAFLFEEDEIKIEELTFLMASIPETRFPVKVGCMS